jgi:DUF971 family protein
MWRESSRGRTCPDPSGTSRVNRGHLLHLGTMFEGAGSCHSASMGHIMHTPAAIEADRAAGTLIIQWDDGHRSQYALARLRWNCPCAICAGEWGRPGRLASLDTLPEEEIRLADMHMVGTYALSPIWESGHHTGIYSFEYLRSLCPCMQCRTDRPIG